MIHEIRLPEISANVEFGDVAKILVSRGDYVNVDQSIVEMETDKAVVDVPSPFAGVIAEIIAVEGITIKVGDLLMKVDSEGEAQPNYPEKTLVSTHWNVKLPNVPNNANSNTLTSEPDNGSNPTQGKEPTIIEARPPDQVPPASPSVRNKAHELGVDLYQITGSESGGRISEQDVLCKIPIDPKQMSSEALFNRPLPDFSMWGDVERKPMNRVRRITADGMAHSWLSIPHVSQIDHADITNLEEFRKLKAEQVTMAGGKLTITAILVKVVVEALKRFPQVNSSVDMDTHEILYKKYYNIGIAVDTPRGLLVPVVKNADQKSITEIAVEIARLSERSRNRKITPDEMDGGTFTISNLSTVGGAAFTPIIYPPQVAIIGVACATITPVWMKDAWQPRLMLPLTISYDHRVIDGVDGGRFLHCIVDILEQPMGILL